MYQIRGYRVDAIPKAKIAQSATNLCSLLDLSTPSGRKKLRIDKSLENLSDYSITLNPICDNEWAKQTGNHIVGHYCPRTLTISIPNDIYLRACKGDRHALSVILHELGHLVLAHQPKLHFSTEVPTEEEDTEWQADMFAEYALECMGFDTKQLCFDFC